MKKPSTLRVLALLLLICILFIFMVVGAGATTLFILRYVTDLSSYNIIALVIGSILEVIGLITILLRLGGK